MNSDESGLVLIDKPSGISSFDVIRALKPWNVKLGHAGTLDPFATGLLVLLVNKATKFQDRFTNHRKSYEAELILGAVSDSHDPTGSITILVEEANVWEHLRNQGLDSGEISNRIKRSLSGDSMQVPPRHSAIKVAGVRSYKRARIGEEFELPPRAVNIVFEEISFVLPNKLKLRVNCSKGTYIRSLARDIGQELGAVGAYVSALRRTDSGPFSIGSATALDIAKASNFKDLLLDWESIANLSTKC